jgi:glycosyltransferase involved in cell wall biosynthesis
MSSPNAGVTRIASVTSIHGNFDHRISKHATAMAEAGLEVDLVSPWQIGPEHARAGIRFHSFTRAGGRLPRLWQIPGRILPLVAKLSRQVDLIHFHDLDLLPLLAPLSAWCPLVYDVHENYGEEMLVKDYLPGWLRPLLARGVEAGQYGLARIVGNVVLVVPEQERSFPSARIRRIQIANYASRGLIESAPDDYLERTDAVLSTGFQYVNNGSQLLLEIAEQLRGPCPGLRFLISDRFPDAASRAEHRAEIDRRGLADVVELLPMVPSDQMPELLGRGTIGISPTLRVTKQEKALPTKLFEYMAAGLPFVASDLPHPKRLVEETGAGLLAQPEHPQSFVTAIRRLVEDRAFAQTLGQNGQRSVRERYSWEAQMPGLIEFYREILAARGGRAANTAGRC